MGPSEYYKIKNTYATFLLTPFAFFWLRGSGRRIDDGYMTSDHKIANSR